MQVINRQEAVGKVPVLLVGLSKVLCNCSDCYLVYYFFQGCSY